MENMNNICMFFRRKKRSSLWLCASEQGTAKSWSDGVLALPCGTKMFTRVGLQLHCSNVSFLF